MLSLLLSRRSVLLGCRSWYRFKLDSPQQLFGYATFADAALQKNSYPNLRVIQLLVSVTYQLAATTPGSNSCKLKLLRAHRAWPVYIIPFDAPILTHGICNA